MLVLPTIAAVAFGVAACGGDEEPAERAAPPALSTPDPDLELRELEESADAGGEDTSTPPTSAADAGDSVELLRKNFREAAATQLKASGLSDEQVDCMLPKLEASVDDADIEQAMAAGSAEDLLEAGMQAAEECGAKLG
jgi:hypothetical protein